MTRRPTSAMASERAPERVRQYAPGRAIDRRTYCRTDQRCHDSHPRCGKPQYHPLYMLIRHALVKKEHFEMTTCHTYSWLMAQRQPAKQPPCSRKPLPQARPLEHARTRSLKKNKTSILVRTKRAPLVAAAARCSIQIVGVSKFLLSAVVSRAAGAAGDEAFEPPLALLTSASTLDFALARKDAIDVDKS